MTVFVETTTAEILSMKTDTEHEDRDTEHEDRDIGHDDRDTGREDRDTRHQECHRLCRGEIIAEDRQNQKLLQVMFITSHHPPESGSDMN